MSGAFSSICRRRLAGAAVDRVAVADHEALEGKLEQVVNALSSGAAIMKGRPSDRVAECNLVVEAHDLGVSDRPPARRALDVVHEVSDEERRAWPMHQYGSSSMNPSMCTSSNIAESSLSGSTSCRRPTLRSGRFSPARPEHARSR